LLGKPKKRGNKFAASKIARTSKDYDDAGFSRGTKTNASAKRVDQSFGHLIASDR
jgi:hypothetical protein